MSISELTGSHISRVVAAETTKESMLHLFCRNEQDIIEEQFLPFRPFLL